MEMFVGEPPQNRKSNHPFSLRKNRKNRRVSKRNDLPPTGPLTTRLFSDSGNLNYVSLCVCGKDLADRTLKFIPQASQFSNAQAHWEHLVANLSFNAVATRRRNASYLDNRFFPGEKLRQMPAGVPYPIFEDRRENNFPMSTRSEIRNSKHETRNKSQILISNASTPVCSRAFWHSCFEFVSDFAPVESVKRRAWYLDRKKWKLNSGRIL